MINPHRNTLVIAAVVGSTGLLAGCDAEQSSNPLSPNIAGPLAGVTITTPAAVQPANGVLIASTQEPVTLTFSSASSNSVRPFTYEIQIATDLAFTRIVLRISDVEPNETGQIVVAIPQTLMPGQTYYWRVRAMDGANTGPYSPTASFELFIPVVIGLPVIGGPNGLTIPTNTPSLTVTNPDITGPAESIMYRFELSTEPTFANPSGVLTVSPSAGTTTSVSPGALAYNQQFFWRARVSALARNGTVVGAWSATASFRTPAPAVVIPAPTPTSPVNGDTVTALRPTLLAANGAVSGAAGAVTYQFVVDDSSSFSTPASSFSVTRSATGSTAGIVTVDLVANRQYFWRVRGTNGTVTSAWSATATFVTVATAPPPGGALPLPDMSALVDQVAAENPGALTNSCQDSGGSWEFMDLVVARLRQVDGRWGYNCKRGNCGDISQDVVDYHFGNGSASGSTEVYIIDIIAGHCGPDPSSTWIDQTGPTASSGTIGRWIFPR